MKISHPNATLTKTKIKRPSTGGGGAGASVPILPELRAYDWGNSPANTTLSVATFVQDGDYLLAFCLLNLGTAGGPDGSGWTLLADGSGSGDVCKVWGKFWHTGDQTVYTFTRSGEGPFGIMAYSGVTGVHADKSATSAQNYGSPLFTDLPDSWAAKGVGHRALMFVQVEDVGDWPLHAGADGWRRELDMRRWDRGGMVLSTPDPIQWSAPLGARLWMQWWSNSCCILLLGATDVPGTWDQFPSTTRPTYIGGGGYGWNSPATFPGGAQVGDFWILALANSSFDVRVGLGHEQKDRGWWMLGGYCPGFAAYMLGRFITAQDIADGGPSSAVGAMEGASRGIALLRGVDPVVPLRRPIEYLYGNTVAFAPVDAAVNTILAAVGGSNAHTAYSIGGFTGGFDHVRWNPMGHFAYRDVTDGEVVSGLSMHDNEGQAIGAVLLELRGKR